MTKFTPTPLLARAWIPERSRDLPPGRGGHERGVGGATVAAMEHPVAQVLADRVRAGSQPGARGDAHCVALVLEGGGMRGVVSAAMTAALERLGMTPAFDLVVGSSAGAINGAALLAGSAQRAAEAYCGPLASRSFVNPLRILRGKPVIDVNDVLALAGGLDPRGHERIVEGAAALHCVAVDVDSARTVDLHGMRTPEELWAAILASSRMPWAGGPPIEIDSRRYLDGGMGAPIPVSEALTAGATHVLALQTRPHGVPRRSASRIGDRLIERHLRRLNPALACALPRADRGLRGARRGHRAAVGGCGRRAAARSGRAPGGGHALRRPARAPPGGPRRGRRRRPAPGGAGARGRAASCARRRPAELSSAARRDRRHRPARRQEHAAGVQLLEVAARPCFVESCALQQAHDAGVADRVHPLDAVRIGLDLLARRVGETALAPGLAGERAGVRGLRACCSSSKLPTGSSGSTWPANEPTGSSRTSPMPLAVSTSTSRPSTPESSADWTAFTASPCEA